MNTPPRSYDYRSNSSDSSYVWVRRDVIQELHENNGVLPKNWKPTLSGASSGRSHESWQWIKAKLLSTSAIGADSRIPIKQTPTNSSSSSSNNNNNSPFGQTIKLRKVRGSVMTAETSSSDVKKIFTVLIDDPDASPVLNNQRFEFEATSTSDKKDAYVQMANSWWCKKSPQPPDDLTTLTHLHEPAVVYCLRKRYDHELIYTYTGRILLALNPFRSISGLYGKDVVKRYQQVAAATTATPVVLPPHVYATAQDAYTSMLRDERNQSILVSGESGAGKTVTTKIILGYLTSLSSQRQQKQGPAAVRKEETGIESQVVQSNPILESFGNARTIRNDNSSRFGKFVDVRFHAVSGRLQAASIETYLLEKVRLIAPCPGERNYHIFYELLVGLPQRERKTFSLGNAVAQDFKMTSISGTFDRRDGVNDRTTYRELRVALAAVGVSTMEATQLFSVCCALLHCSNLVFVETGTGCEIDPSSNKSLHCANELLGVSPEAFTKALCYSAIEARGEVLLKRLTKEQATKALEALMKSTYAAMFQQIVEKINQSIAVQESARMNNEPVVSIGVLDIFGFECFDTNSFEQLCINFCNEALQQQFNHFVFKEEQEEYQREGIEWSFISFPDNQDVLDLIEKKHSGIISILDEQSMLARSTDQSFARAMYDKCSNHPRFGASSSQRICGQFSIEHYAGIVEYTTDTFVEKNKHELPKETTELLTSSSFEFIKGLGVTLANTRAQVQSGLINGRGLRRSPSSLVKESVGSQFSGQLRELRRKIEETAPHYIRCLKANDKLVPGNFAASVVADQLRCAGVLEAIRVTRVGFPHRYSHGEFLRRYSILAKNKMSQNRRHYVDRDLCETLVKHLGVSSPKALTGIGEKKNVGGPSRTKSWNSENLGIQVGRTKVFLQLVAFELLEHQRSRVIEKSATILQAHSRTFLARQNFLMMLECVLILQRFARRLCAMRLAASTRIDMYATRIQKYWRGFLAERDFVAKLFVAQWCQACYRGMMARDVVALMMLEQKVEKIQRAWRKFRSRNRVKRIVNAAIIVQRKFRQERARSRARERRLQKQKIPENKPRETSRAARESNQFRFASVSPTCQVQSINKVPSSGQSEISEVSLLKNEILSLQLKLARLESLPSSAMDQVPREVYQVPPLARIKGEEALQSLHVIHDVQIPYSRKTLLEADMEYNNVSMLEADMEYTKVSTPRNMAFSDRRSLRQVSPPFEGPPSGRGPASQDLPAAMAEAAFRAEVSTLHRALYSGDAVSAAHVIARSDESLTLVNECNPAGKSPLHMAVASENIVLTNLLLNVGAVANWQDFDGNTPLHISNNSEITGLILEKGGASPNIPNNDGHSALHMAVGRLDVASVQQILLYNADVNIADNLNWLTPLHMVARKIDDNFSQDGARTRIANLLCSAKSPQNADMDCQDKNGNTPLHHVAILETEAACDLLRIFLGNGANPNISNARGQTPLHLLCHNNGLRKVNVMQEMLHNMLYHAANPNIPSRTGCTALHLTLYHRDVDSAVQLISRGAELHLLWQKPQKWSSFWEDMGTSDVLALDMVSDGNALHRLLAAISKPPKWAPNRPWCMHCKSVLGSFARALHCRHCGRLVCGACALRRLDPSFFPQSFEVYESSWVCTVCDGILLSRKHDEDVSTQPNTSVLGDEDSTTVSRISF